MKLCRLRQHSYIGKQCPFCLATWRESKKEILAQKKKVYDKANRLIFAEKQKIRRQENREAFLAYGKQYRRNNKAKRTALQVKREANKKLRTPSWLTKEHFQQIESLYETAASLFSIWNIRMDVDHIVPMQGHNVSGLHVPWNLQILPHEDNMSKGNR